ncbi:MAG: MtaA/CmuA family methyltransferase [Dethiobacter sp.]|jgi:[methyl-Co(III) methanol-specific corrinoid protein]:coenzyme M methyltransferase|nr:MAG: MtaA/CmuA family methyltransferase [Dethiobacter sp.]
MTLTSKERVLNQLQGKEIDRVPCYSGMGNVTVTGLKQLGYRFPHVHSDAEKMAKLAATSYKLFGYECAVVPFDFCLEAEALGCVINPYEDVEHLLYPTIKEKAIHSEAEMATFPVPEDLENVGRVPVVVEAIRRLKEDIGDKVAVGTYFTAPFTLAGQIFDLDQLFKLSFKKQDLVGQMLDRLADVLIELGKIYRDAGADYINVREMGATTDILSPRSFKSLILPPLQKIHAALSALGIPNILHICGATNAIVPLMIEAGADAITVEVKNNMLKTREDIGFEPLVFGNLDAYKLFVHDSVEDVEKAVITALEQSVDAIWPGCDIWPEAKPENFKAMVEATEKYGAEKWVRKQKSAS